MNQSRFLICPSASQPNLPARINRLWMPIDFNPEDCTVVYPCFASTLLDLMRADPDFPPAERKNNSPSWLLYLRTVSNDSLNLILRFDNCVILSNNER